MHGGQKQAAEAHRGVVDQEAVAGLAVATYAAKLLHELLGRPLATRTHV